MDKIVEIIEPSVLREQLYNSSLWKHLSSIKDKRNQKQIRYSLPVILTIFILSTLSGQYGYRKTYRFILRHKDFLKALFQLERLPGLKTLWYAMRSFDIEDFNNAFTAWVREYYGIPEGTHIAIDGKVIRGGMENCQNSDQNAVLVISAFETLCEQVLGMVIQETNSQNEISAFVDLVKESGTNNIFTGDALHCQVNTTEVIDETGNTYVLRVKGNQPKLKKAVKEVHQSQEAVDSFEINRKKRKANYKMTVYSCENSSIDSKWKSIKRIGVLVRVSENKKKKLVKEICYFITNKEMSAQEMESLIHEHWGIENKLHWEKDVVLKEDAQRYSKLDTGKKMSTINTIANNLFRGGPFSTARVSIDMLAHNMVQLVNLMCGKLNTQT